VRPALRSRSSLRETDSLPLPCALYACVLYAAGRDLLADGDLDALFADRKQGCTPPASQARVCSHDGLPRPFCCAPARHHALRAGCLHSCVQSASGKRHRICAGGTNTAEEKALTHTPVLSPAPLCTDSLLSRSATPRWWKLMCHAVSSA